MSKNSPAWLANQKRLAALGLLGPANKNTFSDSYGTAGGGLAGVKAAQLQHGPNVYTKQEAANIAQTGTRLGPTPTTASVFSSSAPVQQNVPTTDGGGVSTNTTKDYQKTIDELKALNTGAAGSTVTEDIRQGLIDETIQKKYGGGMSAAELQDFETLVGRLEGSKMRQASQANRARQRDTYAGGLANIMRNF
jgi:hypothetical protein